MVPNIQFMRRPGHRPLAAFFLVAASLVAAAEPETNRTFAARAEAEFHRAQNQFQTNTNDSTTAWQFARACFDFNDFVTNNAARAELADQGIAACRQLLARESNSAQGHYYLAIELGQLADTKRNLAAYKMVKEMEHEFKTAGDLDEHFDYAGTARCLGLLYRDAPGWPVSIGSRRKAREWLERAANLAPGYPENQLNLVESYLRWRERTEAERAWQTLDALWPTAQTNFVGEAWERSWADWTARKTAVEQSLAQGPQPVKPPKNRR
jgi:hypothetical protein